MALIKCPQCGANISDRAQQCPKCGSSLQLQFEGSTASSIEESTNNKGLIFLNVFLLLVLIGCVAFALTSRQSAQFGINSDNYFTAEDSALTISQLTAMAEDNNVKAIDMLAARYDHGGLGVNKDKNQAIALLKKSANLGSPYAQCQLGGYYFDGIGVEKDYEKGLELLKESARQGYSDAYRIIGYIIVTGQGTKVDNELSFMFFKIASDIGNLQATLVLGDDYFLGMGTKTDYTKAVECYQKAIDHAFAKYRMSYFYQEGLGGLPKDQAKANELYEKACQNSIVQRYIGKSRYDKGDYEEALVWLVRSANLGDATAQYLLGDAYEKGNGVYPDYDKAVYWYKKAQASNMPLAAAALNRLYKSQSEYSNY